MAKPSGNSALQETDIGPVPEDWGLARLRELTYEATERNQRLAYGREDVLSVDNELGLIPSDRLLGEDFTRYKLVRRNQFAYNPMRLNVGSLGLWKDDRVGVVSPDYIVFGCREDQLDSDFLDLFRGSAAWKWQILQSGQGSVRIRYYYRHIAEFWVPRPPLPEQRAIAHVLRTVQRAKEATEKIIAATRQLKASLARHLFTYGPVPVEEADQVTLRGTDFGSVPKLWRISPLDSCSEVQTGVAKGRRLNGAETISVPYLRVANVQDGFLDLSEMKSIEIRRSELERYSLQAGDVVLTEGGDFDKLGRGFIWNGEVRCCVHQNHIFAVRANRRMLLPQFLAYLTQGPYGKAYFLSVAHKTTNLACINTTKLKAFPALLPSIEEQQVVVDAPSAVDRKIAVEEAKRRAIDSLFKTLLHHLMIGKLRARDLDPADHSHDGTAAG